jgi:hypothetical protein
MQLSQGGQHLSLSPRARPRVVGDGLMLDGSLDPDFGFENNEELDDLEAGGSLDAAQGGRPHWPSESPPAVREGGGGGKQHQPQRSSQRQGRDPQMIELEAAIGSGGLAGYEEDVDGGEDIDALRLDDDSLHLAQHELDEEEEFRAAIGLDSSTEQIQ